MTDKLNIAVLGYGTVGKTLVDLIDAHEEALGLHVKYVLRRPGKAAGSRMVDNVETILRDVDVAAVVDVLPGRDPSLSLIRDALAARLSVVSANKAALAADLLALEALAQQAGVHLLYEAACGGGMPCVEAIKKAARFDEIRAMSGILNGTCNFMIDAMATEHLTFAAALSQAQTLGYAEANPKADISGEDVRNKAIIATSIAFHGAVNPHFPVSGIEGFELAMLERLANDGKCLRLMMLARAEGQRYAVGVAPIILSATAQPARIRRNLNFLSMEGHVVGPLTFSGQGAGGRPTADAIIQDLITLRNKTAERPTFTRELVYDPTLITGVAYINGQRLENVTLEAATVAAQRQSQFLAFEPSVA